MKLCKTLGIAITAYSSLGPQSYVELGADKGAQNLLEHNLIQSIASKHSKCESPTSAYPPTAPDRLRRIAYAANAQILLRWAVQQGLAVIPKSNNHDRLVQNLNVDQFTLTEDEMKSISSLNINLRVRVRLIASGGCGTDVCARSSTTRPTSIRAWGSLRERARASGRKREVVCALYYTCCIYPRAIERCESTA